MGKGVARRSFQACSRDSLPSRSTNRLVEGGAHRKLARHSRKLARHEVAKAWIVEGEFTRPPPHTNTEYVAAQHDYP